MQSAWRSSFLPWWSTGDSLVAWLDRTDRTHETYRSHDFRLIQDRQHILLVHDEDFFLLGAVFELVAGPGSEEDGVAFFHLQALAAAVVEQFAGPDGHDRALLRLLLGA